MSKVILLMYQPRNSPLGNAPLTAFYACAGHPNVTKSLNAPHFQKKAEKIALFFEEVSRHA